MVDYLYFWLAKTLVEFGIAIVFASPILLIVLYLSVNNAIRKWRCKHESIYENRNCHAMCKKCHTDLGFIGTYLEEKKTSK